MQLLSQHRVPRLGGMPSTAGVTRTFRPRARAHSRGTRCVAMLLGVVLGHAVPLRAQPRAFLGIESASAGAALPGEWRTRAVRGERAPTSRVMDSAGTRFLRVEGTDVAGWFVRPVEPALRPSAGALMWRWRAPVAPAGADLRARETDDAPLRVFVAFGKLRAFGRAPRTIFYSLGGPEPVHHARPGHGSRDVYVVRAGASADATSWVDVRVDPFADYRRAWGEEPPDIAVVGLLQDTEQTRSRAVADLAWIRWVPDGGT